MAGPPPWAGWLQEAAAHLAAGRAAPARALCKRVLAQVPGQPDALNLLGTAALHAHAPAEAERCFASALKARPGDAGFLANLGQARLRQGKAAAAETVLRQATAAAPRLAQAWRGLGEALLALGRAEEAARALETLTRLTPASASAWGLLGRARLAAGQDRAGVEALRAALDRDSNHLPALIALSRAAPEVVAAPERLAALDRAAALAPGDAGVRGHLALVLAQAGRGGDAIPHAEAALRAEATNPLAPLALAQAAVLAGDLPTAEQWLTRTPHTPDTAPQAFSLHAAIANRQGAHAAAVAAMTAAHAARPTVDCTAFTQRLDALEAHAAALPPCPPRPMARMAPVFFVGFPRSGTTLMEQVLAAHPAFVTSDEQPFLARAIAALPGRYPQDLAVLDPRPATAAYHAAVAAALPEAGGRRLVDKLPLNLLHLPAVAALFPAAPVIVALRDPRDVVISTFFQLYQPNPAMAAMASLDGAARFYDRVMGLWLLYRKRLGLPFLEYRYEDLIADFDAVVGRILAFVGEDWDDAVRDFAARARRRAIATPSAAAVGQGLNRSAVGRWQPYAEAGLLDAVLPVLEPWVKRWGY